MDRTIHVSTCESMSISIYKSDSSLPAECRFCWTFSPSDVDIIHADEELNNNVTILNEYGEERDRRFFTYFCIPVWGGRNAINKGATPT